MLEVVSLSVGIDWDQQPVCDWSILSSSPLLAVTLQALAAPPSSLLALPSTPIFIYKYIPRLTFCLCMYMCAHVSARAGFKLPTRQDSKWREILSRCLACYFPAHLIYESEQGFLRNNITATVTQHSKTHLLTHHRSHRRVSCQSGRMCQP